MTGSIVSSEPVVTQMTVGTLAANAIVGAVLYVTHHFTHANIDPAPVMAVANLVVVTGLSVLTRGKVTPTETVGQLVAQAATEAEAGGRAKALTELRQLAGPVAEAAGVAPEKVVDQFLARIGAVLAPRPVTAPLVASETVQGAAAQLVPVVQPTVVPSTPVGPPTVG